MAVLALVFLSLGDGEMDFISSGFFNLFNVMAVLALVFLSLGDREMDFIRRGGEYEVDDQGPRSSKKGKLG